MRVHKIYRKWRDEDGVVQEDCRDPNSLWDSFLGVRVHVVLLTSAKCKGVVINCWDGCLIVLGDDDEREYIIPCTAIAMIEKEPPRNHLRVV